jgi:hypothetical protein
MNCLANYGISCVSYAFVQRQVLMDCNKIMQLFAAPALICNIFFINSNSNGTWEKCVSDPDYVTGCNQALDWPVPPKSEFLRLIVFF